ncbi:hypothetical protein QJQ45_022726, partial [Haematococcus lacustris]
MGVATVTPHRVGCANRPTAARPAAPANAVCAATHVSNLTSVLRSHAFHGHIVPARWPGSSIDSRSDYHCCSINGSSASGCSTSLRSWVSARCSCNPQRARPPNSYGIYKKRRHIQSLHTARNPKRVRPPRTAEGQQEDTRGAELGAGQASY